MLARVGALSLLIGCSGAVLAQPAPSQDALNWMRLRVSEHVQRAPYLWSQEQVDAPVGTLFLTQSPDGRRITRENRELAAKSAMAQARAGNMQQFLLADVSGVGRIDRAMLRQVLTRSTGGRPQAATPQTEETIESYFRDADLDADGFVTYEEAARAADMHIASRSSSHSSQAIPADLDLDGDGTVTIEEYTSVARTVFGEIDADRDGRISQAEAMRYQAETVQRVSRDAQARAARLATVKDARTKAANCAIPAWDPGTMLAAVLAAGSPRGVADVAIGGGAEALGTVNVHVEPGERTISVVLQSPKPTLWQFTGEIGRIARVFVSQEEVTAPSVFWGPDGPLASPLRRPEQRSGSGVTGIASEKVGFASRVGCLPAAGQRADAAFRDRLSAALGREPDVVAGPAVMTTARLPSGTALDDDAFPNAIGVPSDTPGGPLWAMLAASRRALVHVDASAVTAALPVQAAPLPGLAGLAAMVDDGRARITGWMTETRFMGPNGQVGPTIIGGGANTRVVPGALGEPKVTRVPSEMLILAPVTLPKGLSGSGLERLIVARGVPTPLGERAAICIVREEDARPVEGSRCH